MSMSEKAEETLDNRREIKIGVVVEKAFFKSNSIIQAKLPIFSKNIIHFPNVNW